MKASIIITTFGRPMFLQRAINSVLNQSFKNYEILVIDDNGKGTVAQKLTRSKIPINPYTNYFALDVNSGACVARNKGVDLASGEFLFFLDDDDEFLDNKLQDQIDFLEKHKNYDGCLAAFKRLDHIGKEIFSTSNMPMVGDFKSFVLNGNFFTPMLCIRKSSFMKTDGFINIPRFQDNFFLMNALKKGLSFGTMEIALHVMHEHNEARITSASIEKTEKSLQQIKKFVERHKNDFSKIEWDFFIVKQLRTLAVTKYISQEKKNKAFFCNRFYDNLSKNIKI